MSVEVDFAVLLFVPLRIEQQIFDVEKTLDVLRVKLGTIRYGTRVIIRYVIFNGPLCDLVAFVVFDVSMKLVIPPPGTSGPSALLSTLIKICLSIGVFRQLELLVAE